MSEPRKRGAWKRVVAAAAPQLAHALGGPLAGAAVRAIAEKVLGDPEADETRLEQALAAPSPAQLAALRQAEAEFVRAMQELEIDLERIAAADRDSARRRQTEMKDWTPSVLGFAIIAGFFCVLVAMMGGAIPAGAETEFSILLGALATMTAAVVNYFFGSSAGSARKNELLAGAARRG
ncbi:MAG: hypothetical protein AAGL49_13515, partial [Pseudomonadota bacterium]